VQDAQIEREYREDDDVESNPAPEAVQGPGREARCAVKLTTL
jgi:hypothetical protein